MSKKKADATAIDVFQTRGKSLSERSEGENQFSKPFGKGAGETPVELSDALRTFLQQQGASTDLKVQDAQHARTQAAHARDMASVGQVMLGYWLNCIQAIEGSDGFKGAIADLQISKSTAYNAVQEFQLFSRFDDLNVVRALATLGPNKALEFRNWEDDDIKALVSGKRVHALTYDEAIDLSVRELKEKSREAMQTKDREISRLQQTTVNLETDLDTLRTEKQRLEHRLAHRFDNLPMPAFAAAAREEAMALTEKMMLCAEGLTATFSNELVGKRKEPDAERFQRQAAGTLFHALLPAVARGNELLKAIADQFGDAVTGGVRFEFQLVPAESAHYTTMRDQIAEEHAKEATNRAVARDRASGRRGRPRKFVK